MRNPVKPEPPITWEELNRLTMQRCGWLNVVQAMARSLDEQNNEIGGGSWREVR